MAVWRHRRRSATETYPDGNSTICHRDYPYRPDVKFLGSYTLPFDIQFSGTYQFSRGVQTGGAGPSILANWAVTSAQITPVIGRALDRRRLEDHSADAGRARLRLERTSTSSISRSRSIPDSTGPACASTSTCITC